MNRLGPFRVGTVDATIDTRSDEFAAAATWAFADLQSNAGPLPTERSIRFEVSCHTQSPLTWSVHRDGEPCELQLRDDAVLGHVQWEFNRLVIETSPTSIHAGAVAVDGRAAILAGTSHSGKTTLTGWLTALHGAEYLTDEVVAVDRNGLVAPYARALGVRSDSPLAGVASTEGVDPSPADRFMSDERLLPATLLPAAVGRTARPVNLVVFPCYDAASALVVRPIQQADVFERLAVLTPGLVGHGRPVFDRLCALVDATNAIEVRYDDVRLAAPAVLDALDGSVAR